MSKHATNDPIDILYCTAALFGLLIYFTIASKIVNFRFELVEM